MLVPLLNRKDAKNYYLGCIQNPKFTSRNAETFSFFLRAFSRRHLHHHHQGQHVDNISFFIQQQHKFLRLQNDCDDENEVFDYFAETKTKRVVLERVLYFEFFSFHVFFPKRRRVFVFDEGEWLSRCVFFFFFFFSREKEEFYELPHQLLLWLEQNEQRSVRSIDGFVLLARENLRGKRFGTDDEFHEG